MGFDDPELAVPPQIRDSDQRIRHSEPGHHRGPREPLHPRLRPHHQLSLPAGFGVRLDGGTAYSGAVITPYYDSLLVKVTAWAPTFAQAIQRMDRALREFRMRGVRTNIPFINNLILHPTFRSGQAITTFIDDTPELFRWPHRRDRATKLLNYIGEVIVNGNPEVKGRADGRAAAVPVPPAAPLPTPPPGTAPEIAGAGADEVCGLAAQAEARCC
jgi:pyruvate carboxylase